MIKSMKITLAAAAALGGVALSSASVSAMPVTGSAVAPAANSNVQDVRWVCGPFRCFYRPNFFYGPRVFYRPYYWGPRWHYWRRW